MVNHFGGCERLPGKRPCQARLFSQVLSFCCALLNTELCLQGAQCDSNSTDSAFLIYTMR